MSTELSNQKKLSEFYEELKRLNIEIVRPDINKSFADFTSDGNFFYYALGAIKNVGFEAINNVIKERLKNGEFKSLIDFVNRVNPKDINKLQLEGLVQAGAFDKLNNNRQSLFKSIPNIILKSKNIHENKATNQIDLFGNQETEDLNFLDNCEDYDVDNKLNKEFETLGFYMSDHPLTSINQFLNSIILPTLMNLRTIKIFLVLISLVLYLKFKKKKLKKEIHME